MVLDDVRSYYAYNAWANARVAGVLAGLDPDRLTMPLASSFPSVIATFAHLVAAEWLWLERWRGTSPPSFPPWLDDPTLPDLLARLDAIEIERAAFLDGLSDADLRDAVSYRTLSGEPYDQPLGDLLLHVVNHSTYHRGQLTTLVRQAGGTPVATDYVLFRRTVPDPDRPSSPRGA